MPTEQKNNTLTGFFVKQKRIGVALLLCLGLWVVLPLTGKGAVWPWKWNQVNKAGDRQGRWRNYYDHKPTQLLDKGRYKKGQQRGVWKTYSQDGLLERTERFEPKKKRIQTTFYHANGRKSHEGMAYLFEEQKVLKYKWHGDWNYYDSVGNWLGWKNYHRGKTFSEKLIIVKSAK